MEGMVNLYIFSVSNTKRSHSFSCATIFQEGRPSQSLIAVAIIQTTSQRSATVANFKGILNESENS